jgi:hypothetical protein
LGFCAPFLSVDYHDQWLASSPLTTLFKSVETWMLDGCFVASTTKKEGAFEVATKE